MTLNRMWPPPAWVRNGVSRLPGWPPAFVVSQVLNRLWWPHIDDDLQAQLSGRVVSVHVEDAGMVCRLVADGRGLRPAERGAPVAVTLRATLPVYWALLQGHADPDTLFFERKMSMEGDTEFGLLIKNTLDAVGPPDWLAAMKREVRHGR